MNKLLLFISFILLNVNTYAQEPLIFVQIDETPDQVIGAKIIKVAYQKLNIPIEIWKMPGKRALIESSRGRVDGEVHRILKVEEDYPSLKRVPTMINYIEPSVFSKKLKFTVTQCAALKSYNIGIVRGVRHAEICTKGMTNVRAFYSSSELMEVLNSERVDIIITAKVNGLIQINKMGLNTISVLSPSLSRRPLYHYLHEKHVDLVPRINKVFKRMTKNGELKKIREQALKDMLKTARPG